MTGLDLAARSPSLESCDHQVRKAHNRLDLTGQVFSRLTAVSQAERNRHNQTTWLCKCECGREVVVSTHKLRSGHTTSCGCFQRQRAAEANLKHGLMQRGNRHELIDVYTNILDRCYNEKSEYYADYGGRGITVCDGWRFGVQGKTGFQCFVEDVGERPKGLTIDRRDNHGNYEPSNVRWASRKEQARNRRSSLLVVLDGHLVSVAEFSERTGINYGTVIGRVRRGWDPSQLAAPLKRGQRT